MCEQPQPQSFVVEDGWGSGWGTKTHHQTQIDPNWCLPTGPNKSLLYIYIHYQHPSPWSCHWLMQYKLAHPCTLNIQVSWHSVHDLKASNPRQQISSAADAADSEICDFCLSLQGHQELWPLLKDRLWHKEIYWDTLQLSSTAPRQIMALCDNLGHLQVSCRVSMIKVWT